MPSLFTKLIASVFVLGAMLFLNTDRAEAGQNLRYATWDPPQHEWIKYGVDRWIKSIGKVTSGRVNVK